MKARPRPKVTVEEIPGLLNAMQAGDAFASYEAAERLSYASPDTPQGLAALRTLLKMPSYTVKPAMKRRALFSLRRLDLLPQDLLPDLLLIVKEESGQLIKIALELLLKLQPLEKSELSYLETLPPYHNYQVESLVLQLMLKGGYVPADILGFFNQAGIHGEEQQARAKELMRTDPAVPAAIVKALMDKGKESYGTQLLFTLCSLAAESPAIVAALQELYKGKDIELQAAAAAAMLEHNPGAKALLEHLLADKETEYSRATRLALSGCGWANVFPDYAVKFLLSCLSKDIPGRGVNAAEILGRAKVPGLAGALTEVLKNSTPQGKINAARALARQAENEPLPQATLRELENCLDKEISLAIYAARALSLCGLKPPAALRRYQEFINLHKDNKDSDPEGHSYRAATGLARDFIHLPEALETLKAALNCVNRMIYSSTIYALTIQGPAAAPMLPAIKELYEKRRKIKKGPWEDLDLREAIKEIKSRPTLKTGGSKR